MVSAVFILSVTGGGWCVCMCACAEVTLGGVCVCAEVSYSGFQSHFPNGSVHSLVMRLFLISIFSFFGHCLEV